MKTNKLRICKVHGEVGYFHVWEQYMDTVPASHMRGGRPAGQVAQMFGIVEFQDRVNRVDPKDIVFGDEENAYLSIMNDRVEGGNKND